MKKIFFSCLIFIFPGFAHEEPTPEAAIFYKIVNDNSQKIVQKTKSDSCQNASHAHVLDCFFSLPIDEQRETFKKFSPAKRRECLRQCNYREFEKFLKAYSEHEWKELYESLTEHERSYWPTTVKEQWIILHKVKDMSELAGDALTIGTLIAGKNVHPIFYVYPGYIFLSLVKDGVNPVKELIIEEEVERYMEKKYEL